MKKKLYKFIDNKPGLVIFGIAAICWLGVYLIFIALGNLLTWRII